MCQTLFEEIGGIYTRREAYLLPDVKMPETKALKIGV